MSLGCGREFNGEHKVEGTPLKCGVHLYFKTAGSNDKSRTLEVHLCDKCREKEK